MNTPPEWIVEEARLAALQSPCLKSRRGVVLYNPALEERRAANGVQLGRSVLDTIIASIGFNGPPDNLRDTFYCTGTDACRRDCAKLCLHAEDRAIRAAGALDDVHDLELVHVKVVDGKVVPGGGPSCWQCSRIVVEVGLQGVWLYESTDVGGEHHADDPLCDCGARANALIGDIVIHRWPSCPATFHSAEWRFYTAENFHRETLRACGLGDKEFHP